jgi:hypothetical protein
MKLPISTNYTITDEAGVEDSVKPLDVSRGYDVNQDSDVITLQQDGNEISVTLEMANELIDVIRRLHP